MVQLTPSGYAAIAFCALAEAGRDPIPGERASACGEPLALWALEGVRRGSTPLARALESLLEPSVGAGAEGDVS